MPLACVMGLKRGVGRGVPGHCSRELRARFDAPARVSVPPWGRGVRGVLEKLKFYKGDTLRNRGALRASISPAG